MNKKTEIFGWSSLLFWITLGVILFFLIPFSNNLIYDENQALQWLDRLKKEEAIVQDTSKKELKKINKIFITWSWQDYQGSNHEISFYINREDYTNAINYRNAYTMKSMSQIYYDFISVSEGPIDSMYNAMLKDIRTKELAGQQILDYVVSAIQTPPYTKITNENECPCNDMGRPWLDDCNPRIDGKGCCNNVQPFAVYTPTEFIVKKTGDCDTKSLIAYALLKKFGYKSALITGRVEGGLHAMLGLAEVYPIIPSREVRYNGRIYYPWEVTSFSNFCKLGNMNMWSIWEDWEVTCE
jgi:hypothetical protein